jgi:hypothetical protein
MEFSLADVQDYVGGRSGMWFLPNRNLVLLVDDDAAVLGELIMLPITKARNP